MIFIKKSKGGLFHIHLYDDHTLCGRELKGETFTTKNQPSLGRICYVCGYRGCLLGGRYRDGKIIKEAPNDPTN